MEYRRQAKKCKARHNRVQFTDTSPGISGRQKLVKVANEKNLVIFDCRS